MVALPAPAQATVNYTRIQAFHSGHAAQVVAPWIGNNLAVEQAAWGPNAHDAQWELLPTTVAGGQTFQYRNRYSLACLDILNDSTAEGAAVVQNPCNAHASQQWTRWQDPVLPVWHVYNRHSNKYLSELATQAGSPDRQGRIELTRVCNLVSGFGRAAEAEQLVRGALDALGEGSLRDEFAALGGMLALTRGRSQQALDEVEPLLAHQDEPTNATVRALLVAISAWGQVGRAQTAVVVGQKIRDDVPDRELPAVMEVGLVGLCYAYGVLGRLDEAEELASSRYEAALDQRAPDLRTLWAPRAGAGGLGAR